MKITMQKEVNGVSCQQAFEEFIKHGRMKNLTSSTLEYYQDYCGKFIAVIGNQTAVETIINTVVEDYTLMLKDSAISPVSVNTSLRAVRAYLYYCMKLGYLKRYDISLIRADKKIKETYTDAELQMLLKKPNIKTCSFLEYRNWVIENYLLATGNRVSTVINIKIKDLDFENECVNLQKTKNRTQQIIPLSRTIVAILVEYLTYRKGEAEDYVFCNTKGNPVDKHRLGNDIANYNNNRGVTKTSIHLFRHTFAKKWILAGGDIFRLQKMLGHSSLEVVKEYVNMFNDDLKNNFNAFNPLEQMTMKKDRISM